MTFTYENKHYRIESGKIFVWSAEHLAYLFIAPLPQHTRRDAGPRARFNLWVQQQDQAECMTDPASV